MKRGKNDLLYLPWNKIQSASVFNAIFFIISRAYVETTTDDEVSCWAELPSMLSIFILIRRTSKLFVTFVKGFLEDKKPNHRITSLEPYWIFKTTFPGIKCFITKLLFLIEPCLEQKVPEAKGKIFLRLQKCYTCGICLWSHWVLGKTHFLKVSTPLKIRMPLPLRTLESKLTWTPCKTKPPGWGGISVSKSNSGVYGVITTAGVQCSFLGYLIILVLEINPVIISALQIGKLFRERPSNLPTATQSICWLTGRAMGPGRLILGA